MNLHKIIQQHRHLTIKMRITRLLLNFTHKRNLPFKTHRILLILNQKFYTNIRPLQLIQIHMKNIRDTFSMYNNRQISKPPNAFWPVSISIPRVRRTRKRSETSFLIHNNLLVLMSND